MASNDTVANQGIHLPPDFHHGPVDNPSSDAPLGVLENFKGTFVGTGFNTIFRPNNKATPTKFQHPVDPLSSAVLELNLTTEELSFSEPLGNVPNRGSKDQGDIALNGVSYLQAVKDVTEPGKKPVGIHTETGFWMHVPASNNNPVLGNTLVRMGSIPHGTTINAQTVSLDSKANSGPPPISARHITPFSTGADQKVHHKQHSQTADNTDTARIPQNLSNFIKEGTITQEILDNPALVLTNINSQIDIKENIVFTVQTDALPSEQGGGTTNIAFLLGKDPASPNARIPKMEATFWIEKVQATITIPSYQPQAQGPQTPLLLQPDFTPTPGKPAPPLPTFSIIPPGPITKPTPIHVTYTQIQYAQKVFLQFSDLTWPHVSVATLVPKAPITVHPSAFDDSSEKHSGWHIPSVVEKVWKEL